jgi:hypothetical protein
MRTKITTLAAICILGFIGTVNVNAANYKNADNNVVVEEVKNANLSLAALAEKTSLESNARFETGKFLLNEDVGAMIDLEREAQMVTKWVVDQEEARIVKKLIDEGKFVEFLSVQSSIANVVEANVDLQKEAQLATKLIVDQAEAKIIQKLIDGGKLAEFN